MSKTVAIFECIDLAEGHASIDREQGIVKGIKLLGYHSQNGRRYDPAGIDPALYEGKQCNVNHVRPGQERSAYDRLGCIRNVQKRESGLYGDLHILTSHPLANAIFEAATRMPGVYGISHAARGRERPGKNGSVIEQVESVQSLDLVGEPATVKGLYESRRAPMRHSITALAESLRASRPGYSRGLEEVAEAGIVSPDMPMEEPLPMEAPPEESVDHEQAILDAAKAVLDDTALDSKQKLDKIKKLLGILDAPASEAPAESESEAPAEESIKAELAGYKMRERVRNAADAAGVKVPGVLLESLKPSITDAQITNLVESLRSSAGGATMRERPRSAAPISGAGAAARQLSESKVPDDGKALGKWLQQGGGQKR